MKLTLLYDCMSRFGKFSFDVQVQERTVYVVVQPFDGENIVNIQGVLYRDVRSMQYILSPLIFQRALQQGQQVAVATSGNCWW